MQAIIAWARQPTSVIGIGVIAGAVTYWVTKDAVLATGASGAVCALISDNSNDAAKAKDILGQVETLEDRARRGAR